MWKTSHTDSVFIEMVKLNVDSFSTSFVTFHCSTSVPLISLKHVFVVSLAQMSVQIHAGVPGLQRCFQLDEKSPVEKEEKTIFICSDVKWLFPVQERKKQ